MIKEKKKKRGERNQNVVAKSKTNALTSNSKSAETLCMSQASNYKTKSGWTPAPLGQPSQPSEPKKHSNNNPERNKPTQLLPVSREQLFGISHRQGLTQSARFLRESFHQRFLRESFHQSMNIMNECLPASLHSQARGIQSSQMQASEV